MTGMNAQNGHGRAAWLLATVAVGALTAGVFAAGAVQGAGFRLRL
jgi:hypothetical protein